MESSDLIAGAREVAERMGSCDPFWLHEGKPPVFKVHEGSSSNGPEMILLHGLFGALSNWDTVFPLFQSYSKPIALSFPLLDAHRSEGKIKALGVYTWYFLQQRKLAPVTLCGNSLGGHVALRLYLADPSAVDCLILTGTSGLYEHSVDALPIRPGAEFVREHMGRVFYHRKFITDHAVNEIAGLLKDRKNVLNLINVARSAKKDNLESVLKEIKCPTLLLWGEEDQVTTMEVAETFHRLIPKSTLVTIKGCGHAPMIEHPEWFSQQVESFLRQNSRYYKNQKSEQKNP